MSGQPTQSRNHVQRTQPAYARNEHEGHIGLPQKRSLSNRPNWCEAGSARHKEKSGSLAGPEESGTKRTLDSYLVSWLNTVVQLGADLAVAHHLDVESERLSVVAADKGRRGAVAPRRI